MAKKLKNYEVLVKALNNFSSGTLDINVLRKGRNVFKKIKESSAKIFYDPYLSFIEENNEPFTLQISNKSKAWDGTMYYSIDGKTWNTWSGNNISSSNDGKLFVRGKSNTCVSYVKGFKPWVLSPDKRIQCIGNIENLLDYEVVAQGGHPIMAKMCCNSMFSGCTSLTTAPELPATTLAEGCYCYMFYNCTLLTTAPELPAIALATDCYFYMFRNCTSLTSAPSLPATTLANNCYSNMFYGCTSLDSAPSLPAKTLVEYCYSDMFHDCTSLTSVPELPATTLAEYCYKRMFQGCTNLTGKIHCPASTANDANRLDANANIPENTATVVYDL